MAVDLPVPKASFWDTIEQMTKNHCAPEVAKEIVKDQQERRQKIETEAATKTPKYVVPRYDPVHPEDTAAMAATRRARSQGWVEPPPAHYANASLAELTRDQDPVQTVAQWVAAPTALLGLGGIAGAGKTWAAIAVGNKFSGDVRCLMVTARDMFQRLRAEQMDAAQPFSKILRSAGLLILDDLGTKPPTDYESAEFLAVIEHRRTHHRPEQPLMTVVTTNLSSQAINDSWSDRVQWRLFDQPAVMARIYRRST